MRELGCSKCRSLAKTTVAAKGCSGTEQAWWQAVYPPIMGVRSLCEPMLPCLARRMSCRARYYWLIELGGWQLGTAVERATTALNSPAVWSGLGLWPCGDYRNCWYWCVGCRCWQCDMAVTQLDECGEANQSSWHVDKSRHSHEHNLCWWWFVRGLLLAWRVFIVARWASVTIQQPSRGRPQFCWGRPLSFWWSVQRKMLNKKTDWMRFFYLTKGVCVFIQNQARILGIHPFRDRMWMLLRAVSFLVCCIECRYIRWRFHSFVSEGFLPDPDFSETSIHGGNLALGMLQSAGVWLRCFPKFDQKIGRWYIWWKNEPLPHLWWASLTFCTSGTWWCFSTWIKPSVAYKNMKWKKSPLVN